MLTRVGVTGVRSLWWSPAAVEITTLFLHPGCVRGSALTQKGSHLSRNLEAINEGVGESMDRAYLRDRGRGR